MSPRWLGLDTAESDKKVLNENLPPNYDYRVHFFKLDKKAIHDAESQFTAKMSVRLGNCTDDGIKSFLDSFYFFTSTTYNMKDRDRRPKIVEGRVPRVIVSGWRKCHHRVRKRVSKITQVLSKDEVKDKNSECDAKLCFSLRNHQHNHDTCQEYSLEFHLFNHHNHPVCASDTLKFHLHNHI